MLKNSVKRKIARAWHIVEQSCPSFTIEVFGKLIKIVEQSVPPTAKEIKMARKNVPWNLRKHICVRKSVKVYGWSIETDNELECFYSELA